MDDYKNSSDTVHHTAEIQNRQAKKKFITKKMSLLALVVCTIVLLATNPTAQTLKDQISKLDISMESVDKYSFLVKKSIKVTNISKHNFLFFSFANVTILNDTAYGGRTILPFTYEECYIGVLGNWVESVYICRFLLSESHKDYQDQILKKQPKEY